MKVILSYYAGFVDGEGYIGIKKYDRHKKKGYSPTYSERVSVGGNSELIIRSFNDIVVGNICKHKPSKLSKHPFYTWEVTDAKARQFLNLIYPYLKVKKTEAALVLALSKNKDKNNKRKRVPDEDIKLRENLYILIKTLHTYDRYE